MVHILDCFRRNGHAVIGSSREICRLMIPEHEFQEDRAEDRACDNEEDGSDQRINTALRRDQPLTGRIDRQRNFAACDHTETGSERFFFIIAEAFCNDTAANDLTDHTCGNESEHEPHAGQDKAAEIGADADKSEEHGGKEHIAADNDLSVNELAVAEAAEHQTRHISAGDGSDSEQFLSAISKEETGGKGKDTGSALVGKRGRKADV